MDCGNDPSFGDRNTIFYGCNLKNGKQFGTLAEAYQSKTRKTINTLHQSHILNIDGRGDASEWVVFAAYTCGKDSIVIGKTPKQFKKLLTNIKRRSIFRSGLEVTPDDRIVTLIACAHDFPGARFVVHARRLRSGEDAAEVGYVLT